MAKAESQAETAELEGIQEASRTAWETRRLEVLRDAIIERMKNTPAEEKVWQYVHSSADIHGYRAEYATAIYKARAIEEIPYDKVNKGTWRRYQSDVYTCRRDEAGKKLDKAAMLICSKALGLNRISVVADNYIRGL